MTLHIKLFLVAIILAGGRVSSFSITPPAHVRRGGLVRKEFSSKSVSFNAAATSAGRSAPSANKGRASTTVLEAIPSWAVYSLTHIVAGVSSAPLVARATDSWYKRIPLPPWTPPNFVFGPVWTLLYGLMGVSLSRIVQSGSPSTRLATKVWAFHLALNLSWATVFFGFKNLRLGLIINYLLIGSLGYVLFLFRSMDPLSAYLLIPYLLWLVYATKLNQVICKLNPVLGGVNKAMILADQYANGDGDGYNDDMLQYDIKQLQAAAAKYAGL